MPSRDKKDLMPNLREAYEYACDTYQSHYPDAPQPFLTCTYRSPKEQDELYAIGRTVKGTKVTNAKGGESKHNFLPSQAFDIAFIGLNKKLDWSPKLFENFARIIMKYNSNVKWGGNFKTLKDAPHFEI